MSSPIADVERVVAAFAGAWNQHDMEAFAELFAPDAEFVNVVGMWWRGRAEIKAAHEFTHSAMFKSSHLTILETTVRFPAPQLAIARSRWLLENHVSPDGATLPARSGVLVNVLALRDGRWSIIDSQNTDIIEGVVSRPQ
jgi:uncharacterized protein (TIGR02246 family)